MLTLSASRCGDVLPEVVSGSHCHPLPFCVKVAQTWEGEMISKTSRPRPGRGACAEWLPLAREIDVLPENPCRPGPVESFCSPNSPQRIPAKPIYMEN